jgi:uncharacterized protein YjeT (DUF2065 family)
MKKTILILSFSVIFAIGGLIPALAQDQPKPQKDTVNMDTDAKPTFYYAVEDEKTESKTGKISAVEIVLIVGAGIIVVGAVAYFLLKKKK